MDLGVEGEILAHAAAYDARTALMFYPTETGFSVRHFGRSVTGCALWAFGIDLQDFVGSVWQGLKTAALCAKR